MIETTDWLSGKPNRAQMQVQDVLDASVSKIEEVHNWVQWAFPLPEPSRAVINTPTASVKELMAQGSDPVLSPQIDLLFQKYMWFLGETSDWKSRSDHNWLRITRIIRCQFLRGKIEDAQKLYSYALKECAHLQGNPAFERATNHWNAAVHGIAL